LDLHTNLFIGKIPELGGALTYLDISANSISGSIPENIGLLSKLELLHLGWNQLTGTIPYQLCALTELEVLILYTNKLVGDIPYEFGDLKSLGTTFYVESFFCVYLFREYVLIFLKYSLDHSLFDDQYLYYNSSISVANE